MVKYWIAVASKDHVMMGVSKGFAQSGHGKRTGIARMNAGDVVIYYSPKMEYEGNEPLHAITAIGEIADDEIFQADEGPDWKPFRRRVRYIWTGELPLGPLICKLSFIKNKVNWGSVFRFGLVEIPQEDFERIKNNTGRIK
ncbi:MAG TPA: EVE domain-containing protein [Methanomassiliicoccales archaeon]|jgi:predicted RNA-binding protein